MLELEQVTHTVSVQITQCLLDGPDVTFSVLNVSFIEMNKVNTCPKRRHCAFAQSQCGPCGLIKSHLTHLHYQQERKQKYKSAPLIIR